MRPITEKVKKKVLEVAQGKCLRREVLGDHECGGRHVTLEHVFIYAGHQINEWWAIIGICAKAHSVDQFQDGGILNKEINQWISINLMTLEDEAKYPRFNWKQRRAYLNGKYGV